METRSSTDPEPGPLGPGQLYRAAWAFYLLLGLGGLVWLGWQHGLLQVGLLLDPSTAWIDVGLGAAGGVALLASWEIMRRTVRGAVELESRLRSMIGPIRNDEAIALAIVSGIAEEVFFRGAVQGAWGFLAATVLFAVLHSGPGRELKLWALFAVVAGLLLGGLMWWRGRLLAPILAHVVVNGVNLTRIAARPASDDTR